MMMRYAKQGSVVSSRVANRDDIIKKYHSRKPKDQCPITEDLRIEDTRGAAKTHKHFSKLFENEKQREERNRKANLELQALVDDDDDDVVALSRPPSPQPASKKSRVKPEATSKNKPSLLGQLRRQ